MDTSGIKYYHYAVYSYATGHIVLKTDEPGEVKRQLAENRSVAHMYGVIHHGGETPGSSWLADR